MLEFSYVCNMGYLFGQLIPDVLVILFIISLFKTSAMLRFRKKKYFSENTFFLKIKWIGHGQKLEFSYVCNVGLLLGQLIPDVIGFLIIISLFNTSATLRFRNKKYFSENTFFLKIKWIGKK